MRVCKCIMISIYFTFFLPQFIYGTENVSIEVLTQTLELTPRDYDLSDEDWTYDNPVVRLILAHECSAFNLNHLSSDFYYSIISQEDFKKWYDWTEYYLNNNPDDPGALILRADAYSRYDMIDSAMYALHKSIKMNSNNAEAFHWLGLLKYQMGKLNEALSDLQKCITIDSNRAEAFYHLGLINQKLKNYERAISCYRHDRVLNRYDKKAYYNEAMCYIYQGKYGEALPILNSLLEIDSTFFPAYLSKANACKKLKMFDEALESYRQLFKFAPSDMDSKILQYKDTIKALEKMQNTKNTEE